MLPYILGFHLASSTRNSFQDRKISTDFSAAPHEQILKEQKSCISVILKSSSMYLIIILFLKISSSCKPTLWINGLTLCKKCFSITWAFSFVCSVCSELDQTPKFEARLRVVSFVWVVGEMSTSKSVEVSVWEVFVWVSSGIRKEHCLRSFLNLIEQMIHKTDKTSLNLLSSVQGSVVEVE